MVVCIHEQVWMDFALWGGLGRDEDLRVIFIILIWDFYIVYFRQDIRYEEDGIEMMR